MREQDAFRLWSLPQVDRDTAVFWICVVLAVTGWALGA